MAGLFFLGVNNGQGYNVLKQMVSNQDYVHDILLILCAIYGLIFVRSILLLCSAVYSACNAAKIIE